MDILIWIVLTICAIFVTVLMLTLEDYAEIKGFGLVLAIVSFTSWVVCGLLAVTLTYTEAVYDATAATIVEYTITYADTWPIAFLFIGISIFPFLIMLKKIPETWPQVKENE